MEPDTEQPVEEVPPTVTENGDHEEVPPPEPEVEEIEENGGPPEEEVERPVIELFVKAAVDKMKNGSCPICHRYFIIFYILREKGLIDLVVTTFLPENPPREVLEFSNGKHYPLVKIHKGVDSNGRDMTGLECDTMDEIECLVDRFDCEEMLGRRESSGESKAERVFEDLYMKFNQFLKNIKDDYGPLVKILEKIDDHLQENGTRFMVGDNIARADCYLLPTLQHIRVAGKAYKEFEIPTELRYVWQYLRIAYETDAFRESCPADREIINHYHGKASCQAKIPRKRASLMAEDRTFSVPEQLLGNGDAEH